MVKHFWRCVHWLGCSFTKHTNTDKYTQMDREIHKDRQKNTEQIFFCKISEFGIWNSNSETMVEKTEFEMFMTEKKIVKEQNKTNYVFILPMQKNL